MQVRQSAAKLVCRLLWAGDFINCPRQTPNRTASHWRLDCSHKWLDSMTNEKSLFVQYVPSDNLTEDGNDDQWRKGDYRFRKHFHFDFDYQQFRCQFELRTWRHFFYTVDERCWLTSYPFSSVFTYCRNIFGFFVIEFYSSFFEQVFFRGLPKFLVP